MVKQMLLLLIILISFGAAAAQESVIILVSNNAADHAAADVWAKKLNVILVVTPWGTLSQNAINEIASSGSKIVYVIGGHVAVPNAESALSNLGLSVLRIGGKDREETSILIAERFSPQKAVLVNGYDVQGVQDSASIAKIENMPLIFIGKDTDIGGRLKTLNIKEAVLIPDP